MRVICFKSHCPFNSLARCIKQEVVLNKDGECTEDPFIGSMMPRKVTLPPQDPLQMVYTLSH